MYLHVILAYFLLLWWPERRLFEPPLDSAWASCLFVFGKLPVIGLLTWLAARAARRSSRSPSPVSTRMQHLYHQANFLLSVAVVIGFAADLFLTRWPEIVHRAPGVSFFPGLADVVILVPFFGSLIILWVASYPADRAVRRAILQVRQIEGAPGPRPPVWSLSQYVRFHLRHHLLIAAVPMTIILVVFHWTRDSRETLVGWLRVPWADQLVLGLAAVLVFLFAPVMLRYLWSTSPLPDGPLRRSLEDMCHNMRLGYREILVWHSHHMMVNAAVMGLIAPLRYILLSDALLESMNERRIEAVFAHEAGHVRHHHMQYFLLFAVSGMLVVSAIVELLVRVATGPHATLPLGEAEIQGVGFVAVLLVWGVGFGWVSRRFERQADLFGVRSITPLLGACPLPCARHGDRNPQPERDGLCATAAEVFKSALDRVAVLNGIPHHERSWRHSSIASRIRFLTSLAGDVVQLRAFDRLIHRIKLTLWAASIGGLILGGVYIWQRPAYRSAVFYNLVEPFSGGETGHTLEREAATR